MNRKQFNRAIIARSKTMERELRPQIEEALKRSPLMEMRFALAVNVTQNIVKDVLAVAMNEQMPQPPEYFGELAIRTACYVITALHPNDQEPMALLVRDGILNKLADMQAQGNTIDGEWE